MKKLLLFFAIIFGTGQIWSQQDHHYTQFMYNKLLINPAYAGARGVPFLTGIYRNQWAGFEGAPKSGLVSFNSPFLSKRVGAGLTISHRQIGIERSTSASVSYSYDLINNKEGLSLRAGLMGSLRSLGINFTKGIPTLPNDPSLATDKTADVFANVGAGIYSTYQEQFYIGFSVPALYGNNIGIDNQNVAIHAKEYQHFYGMAGVNLPLSDDVSLLPAILVKYVKNAPLDADININLDVKKKVTAGLSYRLGGDGRGESIDLLFFMQATSALGLGVAYDFTLSQIRDYSSGSFELLVQYDLKQKKNNMSNPRFFF